MGLIENLLELLFPSKCLICGKIEKKGLCIKCFNILKQNYKYIGKVNYHLDKPYFKHMFLFKYDKRIRSILLDFKFNNKPYFAKGFSNIILNNKKIYCNLKKYDIITYVPIHKQRLKKRGYNQCERLVDYLTKDKKIKNLKKDLLIKCKNIQAQSSLNKTEREKNILGVFKFNNRVNIKNKKILLVDDIYTTGSTVSECSKQLLKFGAKRVDVLTIAKD